VQATIAFVSGCGVTLLIAIILVAGNGGFHPSVPRATQLAHVTS